MASTQQTKRQLLTDEIVKLGQAAFDPTISQTDRRQHVASFSELIDDTSPLSLMPILSSLVQPARTPDWLRPHLMRALALLPLRPRGVRSTIEFILSVHPSTAQPGNAKDTSKSQGANVSLEALTSASKLVSSPPKGMAPEDWFSGIAPQLFALLDGEGGLEMVKAASFIIGYGILGRREYGAPGTSGWKAFAEPLLFSINPSLGPKRILRLEDDDIVDLTKTKILVTSNTLADSLRRLASLLSSHPNPSLSKRLLANLLLPLWCLFSWPASQTQYEEWRAPAGYLLQIYLQLSDVTKLASIMEDIGFSGVRASNRIQWLYVATTSGVHVESAPSQAENGSLDLAIAATKVDSFVALLQQIRDGDGVSSIFLDLCRRWLSVAVKKSHSITLTRTETTDDEGDDGKQLVDGMVMEKLMELIPDKLIRDFSQVLDLAEGVLQSSLELQKLDDDTVGVALSLLNLVFTSPNFKQSEHAQVVSSLRHHLRNIAVSQVKVSATARNLSYLLDFQLSDPENTAVPILADPNEEDRRQHKLAMLYLMSSDAPPPVRAQGLDLVTSLISKNSPILDVGSTLILLSSLLQDEEEYIYLRSIKALTLLSIKHPKAVIKSLIDFYLDLDESHSLDSRLRVGEALLQVIEKAGQTFTGDTARIVGEGLLSVAGRRGVRAKTEERRQKAEALAKAKNLDFKTAWDSLEVEEDQPENEILNQIVTGWEAKGGQEDVRIRASALSIFGSAIEYNVSGLGSSLISGGIDLSVNILAMEPEPEKAILRRPAILLVMSLIKALDEATSNPGFGFAGQSLDDVVRVLKYVAETDNDDLVREYAVDVIEGLETWQVKGLLGSQQIPIPSISEGGLAGLTLQAEIVPGTKPRIEEIE